MLFKTQVTLTQPLKQGSFITFETIHTDTTKRYYPKFWVSNNMELPEYEENGKYDIICSIVPDRDVSNGKDLGRSYLHLKSITKANEESEYYEGFGYVYATYKGIKTWTVTTEDEKEFKVHRLHIEDDFGYGYLWVYGDRTFDLKVGIKYRFSCILCNKRHLINGYPSTKPENKYKGKDIFYTELMMTSYLPVQNKSLNPDGKK